ncbi:MAG: hypothetical protein CL920_23190 [Deltaproteobacteria bacterium]|nr:hypothetical protein [Deltaproteobacteria bacterium]MBU51608.1 hypothetical protein [Deltaproteobacteria bacterium]
MRKIFGWATVSVRWFSKAFSVTRTAFRLLELLDMTILIVTYMTARMLAYFLATVQHLWWKFRRGAVPQVHTPSGEPQGIVFLTPGYTQQSIELVWMAERLRRRGMIVFHADISHNGNVHTQAEILERNRQILADIARLSRQSELPVVFLGMSMGGCHSAWLAKDLYVRHRIKAALVVTVQSPINGSRVATFGEYPCVQELIPGSRGVEETSQCFHYLEHIGVSLKFFSALYDEVVRRRDSRLRRRRGSPVYWSESLPQIGHWGAYQNPWAMSIIAGFISHFLDIPDKEALSAFDSGCFPQLEKQTYRDSVQSIRSAKGLDDTGMYVAVKGDVSESRS